MMEEGHTISGITAASCDFVVVGETRNYDYSQILKASDLVQRGARLIGTNKDIRDRMHDRSIPATGALVSPIELTAERIAYFVGKPNPLIMSHALKRLQLQGIFREDVVIIGDNMETDIIGGVEVEIDTVLLLSGVTSKSDIFKYAFRPTYIFDSLGDLVE